MLLVSPSGWVAAAVRPQLLTYNKMHIIKMHRPVSQHTCLIGVRISWVMANRLDMLTRQMSAVHMCYLVLEIAADQMGPTSRQLRRISTYA